MLLLWVEAAEAVADATPGATSTSVCAWSQRGCCVLCANVTGSDSGQLFSGGKALATACSSSEHGRHVRNGQESVAVVGDRSRVGGFPRGIWETTASWYYSLRRAAAIHILGDIYVLNKTTTELLASKAGQAALRVQARLVLCDTARAGPSVLSGAQGAAAVAAASRRGFLSGWRGLSGDDAGQGAGFGCWFKVGIPKERGSR